jgi:DNA-binding transcriptional regulator LsrR (DeoR family)
MSKQLSLANEIEMICLESLVYEHGENYKVIAKKLNCSRRKIFNMLNQRPSIRETAKSIKTPGVVCFKEHFKEKVEDLFKEREI